MTRRDAAAMVGVVTALCVVTIGFGERIGINQGMGWDGMGYTTWAQDFVGHVLREGVSRYYSQRILPSAMVGGGLHLAGAQPTVAHAIFGFQLLDALALIASAAVWAKIAMTLRWNRTPAWVGFGALFLSFACARHALYYPTLTDATALFLGLVMTWGYVGNHASLLWGVTAVAMVTWPALVPHSVSMLLVPRDEAEASAVPQVRARRLALGVACGAALAYAALCLHYYHAPLPAPGFDKFAKWIRTDLLFLTLPLAMAVVGVGTYLLFAEPEAWNLRRAWRVRSWRYRAIAIAGLAALFLGRGWWIHRAGTNGIGPTLPEFVCQQTLEALRGPGWGLVHHVVYFGPVIVIAVLFWRAIARTAAAWGLAATLALAIVVAFAPSSESRQWIHLFPFLVAITIAATHDRWTPRAAIVFLGAALGWSKLWLHIGYDTPANWLVFPNQKYFMQLGPWASDTMYLVHLVAVVATFGLMYWAVVRQRWRQ